MADRYWVGGGSSTNWNATGNTNWAASSGGSNNASVPVAADVVYFDGVGANAQDNCLINVDVQIASIDFTGYTGVLTHNNNAELRVNGNITFSAGMTYSPANTSQEIKIAGSCTLTSNGQAPSQIYLLGGGATVTLADDLNMYAAKDANVKLDTLSGGMDLNGFNIIGNSAVNRCLVHSSSLGTAENMTFNGGSCQNCDFQDITATDGGGVDLSSATGGAGDCGGNTGITFTTADDWYWHVDAGNISDYSHWYTATNGGGSQMASTRVPLPQDTLYFDASSFDSASQTIVADLPRLGSIDWTGATNSPTFTMTAFSYEIYKSLTLISGMTFSNDETVYFMGRGSYTLTSAGKTFDSFRMNAPGGTITLQDALNCSSTSYVLVGTLDANDQNCTFTRFASGTTSTRGIIMGSGTWTLTSTDVIWDTYPATNLTLTPETSTIVISDTGAGNKEFDGGFVTFNNLSITGGGVGVVTISRSNTFNTFTINAPKTVKFTDGTTTTVSSLVATGTAVDGITLTGSGTGGWTISDSSGTNQVEYCTISYSTATGGATWKASISDGNTDGGNNSGWDFSAVAAGNIKAICGIPWANVKKVSGIAKANIKKIAGVSAQ